MVMNYTTTGYYVQFACCTGFSKVSELCEGMYAWVRASVNCVGCGGAQASVSSSVGYIYACMQSVKVQN